MKRCLSTFICGLLLLLIPMEVLAEWINPAFNPNLIIPDEVFSDTKTFGSATDIQKFLEEKGSVLADTSADFVSTLKEPTSSPLKQQLEDPGYNLERSRTAAELIWDASQMSGLNAQVILVTLNKEQSLINGNFKNRDLQRALDHAMGFACPDGGKCADSTSGFYAQLFGNVNANGDRYIGAPKSLMRSFNTPGGRGPDFGGKTSRVGDTITLGNTLGGFEGVQAQQEVTIGNFSTAALYRYTPHVFNGNYNFWRFFVAWFHYRNGTLIKEVGTDPIFILKDGNRRPLPLFVARARKLNLKKVITVSPMELEKYPLGELYAPINSTVVTLNKMTYVFIGGVKYPASSVVLKQKGLSARKPILITNGEAALFPTGEVLMPRDGTVLRVRGKSKTYLVQSGTMRAFTSFTTRQYRDAKGLLDTELISAADLATYSISGNVVPMNGTLIRAKTGTRTYLMKDGTKRPMTTALFQNLRYKRSDVVTLSETEVDPISLGAAPTPRDGTHYKVKDIGGVYVFKNGKTHLILPAVVTKRRLNPRVVFEFDIVKDWPLGDPIAK